MVDTSAGAVLNVQEKLTTETYVDDHKRLQYIRIREAYSVDILDEGHWCSCSVEYSYRT